MNALEQEKKRLVQDLQDKGEKTLRIVAEKDALLATVKENERLVAEVA